MEFDTARALQRATGRAKSDVANKLVSMLLHEISRRVCAAAGASVSDSSYHKAVLSTFENRCLYCNRGLEHDRAAVEHLDGMNRFRIGLHVPGNVAMACRRCNSEKRRDDQRVQLILASTGWESFLSHDGSRCEKTCKTCEYWTSVWPDSQTRSVMLQKACHRIHHFRLPFARFIQWSDVTRPAVQTRVEKLYRSCQVFATTEIEKLTADIAFDFGLWATN